MGYRWEVVIVPVSDVDRAKEFSQRAGFRVDVDRRAGVDFRIVQLTPQGSGCSVTLMRTDAGLHPDRADFASFSDPDGTGWLLQERRDPAPSSLPA